jgi:hypothetical protein
MATEFRRQESELRKLVILDARYSMNKPRI